jgi:TRAP-type C4-dicarboxylate transport system substrate-binding protein
LYEVAKYLTKCYMLPAATGFFINLDIFNEMPKDIQDLVVKLGLEAQARTNANMIELYYGNYDIMTEQGMTVYPLPGAERDRWAEKVKPYAEELLGKIDPATAEQVRALVQKFDAEYPYPD